MLSSLSGVVLFMVRRRALLWVVASSAPVAISIRRLRRRFHAYAGNRCGPRPRIYHSRRIDDGGPDPAAQDVTLAALRGAVLALVFLALRVGYRYLRGRQGIGLGASSWLVSAGCGSGGFRFQSLWRQRRFPHFRLISCNNWLWVDRRAKPRDCLGVFFAPTIWLAWLIEETLLQPL
jgi:hypothetical protein